jgi:hypothetical protein
MSLLALKPGHFNTMPTSTQGCSTRSGSVRRALGRSPLNEWHARWSRNTSIVGFLVIAFLQNDPGRHENNQWNGSGALKRRRSQCRGRGGASGQFQQSAAKLLDTRGGSQMRCNAVVRVAECRNHQSPASVATLDPQASGTFRKIKCEV